MVYTTFRDNHNNFQISHQSLQKKVGLRSSNLINRKWIEATNAIGISS